MARVVSDSGVCSEHSVTKVSLFMANYRRKLRMRVDIRRKEKVEKTTELAERVKKVQERVGTL